MVSFFKAVFQEFSEDECPRMAAALAYYTAFALAPLLVLVMLVAGLFFDPVDVQGRIARELAEVLGPDGAQQVQEMLRGAVQGDSGGSAGLLSFFGLLFGASGVLVQLQSALNKAWDVKPDPEQGGIRHFFIKRLLSFAMVFGLGFVLVVSLALSVIISALDERISAVLPGSLGEGAAVLFDACMTVAVLTGIFAAMFKWLPDAKIAWRDVLIGSLCTAILFVLGKFLMGSYLGSKNMQSSFGAAGSLALILLWVYYSGIIFLFGAEFTQVWARRRGKGVRPEAGAVRVKTEEKVLRHG